MTNWEKERLAEQLKFFGAKKTKFISVYAKKPRIVCKVKVKSSALSDAIQARHYGNRQIAALYQSQLQGGAFAFNQMMSAQQATQQAAQQAVRGSIGYANGYMGLSGLGQFGGLGGLGGVR